MNKKAWRGKLCDYERETGMVHLHIKEHRELAEPLEERHGTDSPSEPAEPNNPADLDVGLSASRTERKNVFF